MDELKKILQQAIEKKACAAQLEPFKRFIEECDELQAWQTVLGNIVWLQDNEIEVPENLEELAQNQGKKWRKIGQLRVHEFYKNGEFHGERKVWYENCSPWVHEFYKNGELHGERKFWNSEGKLQKHQIWENGNFIKSLL